MNFLFLKHLFSLITVILLISCSGEQETKSLSIPNFVVDNSEVLYHSDISGVAQLQIDTIPVGLTYSVGSNFEEYHRLPNGHLILVDRNASEITCVDEANKLMWKAIPPSPGIDRYTVIGSVFLLLEQEQLLVEDRLNRKVDVFDFKGNFLYGELNPLSFDECAALGNGKIVYDITTNDLSEGDKDYDHQRYLYYEGGKTKVFGTVQEPVNYDAITTNNRNRFTHAFGKLQHRRPLENVIYEVKDNYSAAPIAQFSFQKDDKFSEYLSDFKHKSVAYALERDGLPQPYLALYDEERERFFCIINVGWNTTSMYFTAQDTEKTLVRPSRFYSVNGNIFPAPRYFSQGVFYYQLFKYEFDYLQRAVKEKLSLATIEKELEALKDENSDLDDVYIFRLSIL